MNDSLTAVARQNLSAGMLQSPPTATGPVRTLAGALDGAAAAIPLSLGSVTIVFSRVGADFYVAGVVTTLVAMAIMHLATAANGRPMVWGARIFEATALAAMLDQTASRLPAWGIADTPAVRLALLCTLVTCGGLVALLLGWGRAQRLTRYIPAPVFAGFANSIAVALLISQSRELWSLVSRAATPVVLSVAAASFAVAFTVRRLRPRWPAAALGLLTGLALAFAWRAAGEGSPMVSTGTAFRLPLATADFAALSAGVATADLALAIVVNAAILGVMMFINTAITSQAVTNLDGRRPRHPRDAATTGAGLVIAGVLGAAPLSASQIPSLAVLRNTALRPHVLVALAVGIAAVAASGLLAWVPLAAVAGVLLSEAWFIADRPSAAALVQLAKRKRVPQGTLEDLALITAVTAIAVVVNMVVAAFAGLVLGLFLFALRSARQPVRTVASGRHLASNCARSPQELRMLAEHGHELRVVEFEGDLFFAATASLEASLLKGCDGAACVVLDWSRVRHIDSSVALSIAQFAGAAAARGVPVFHAGCSLKGGNIEEELAQRIPGAVFAADLDGGLELGENHVISLHQDAAGATGESAVNEGVLLYTGLDEAETRALQSAMTQRVFRAGEKLLAAGERSEELLLILRGTASIIVRGEKGHEMRLAGVRPGAIVGEIGFLDLSERSADVIAQEEVTVAALTHEAFQQLCQRAPSAVPKLLGNIAVALAMRLRHTNRVALARARDL